MLLGLNLEWSWIIELIKAIDNSLIAMVLFPLLDRLQIRNRKFGAIDPIACWMI